VAVRSKQDPNQNWHFSQSLPGSGSSLLSNLFFLLEAGATCDPIYLFGISQTQRCGGGEFFLLLDTLFFASP